LTSSIVPASGGFPAAPERRVDRVAIAALLTEHGYPISPKTLAGLASRGEGPSYVKFGRRTMYRPTDALAWAEARAKHVSAEAA